MCLSPRDICIIQSVSKGQKLVVVAADQAGYGIGSGRRYPPGKHRPDGADEGGWMVYWTSFLVRVETPFLGRLATPEHVYAVEAAVTFEVRNPQLVYQRLLQGRDRLPLDDFSKEVADRVRQALSRQACRSSPEALVGGPAMAEGQKELQEELARVYAPVGLAVTEALLVDVSAEIRRRELPLLLMKIEAEAKERGLAIEEAYRQNRAQIDDAAKAGDAQAKRLATQLDHVGSFLDLQAAAQQAQRPTPVEEKSPKRRVVSEAVLMGTKNQAGAHFVVLSPRNPPGYFQMVRPWFFVGRDENCHVTLRSSAVSSLHATLARIGSGLAVIDHESTNGTFHNGERISQRFVETGDVLRIGSYWIVFKLEPGQEFRQIDCSLRGAIASSGRTVPAVDYVSDFAEDEGPTKGLAALVQLVSSASRSATSDARPILIGSDSTCELRLAGGGVARFHAIVYWDAVADDVRGIKDAGVFIEDLHSGRGLLRNGQPVSRARLADGDTLDIAGHRITVCLFGNVPGRAEALRAARPATRKLAITCIEGPAEGASIKLDSQAGRIVIGRAEDCDFVLRCPKVSGRHAEVVCDPAPRGDGSCRPEFILSDLGSTNGTVVNGRLLERHEQHKLRLGDIIRLGKDHDHCDLLVHQAS
jgi:pSer/pThr/pTyr-binding forkhead associated (FHA) protein